MFQCYRRILELEPENVQGLHNLCVVLVERGRLYAAARCLRQAVKVAPEEAYIRRHLSIVLQRLKKDTNPNNQLEIYMNQEDTILKNSEAKLCEQFKESEPELMALEKKMAKGRDTTAHSNEIPNSQNTDNDGNYPEMS